MTGERSRQSLHWLLVSCRRFVKACVAILNQNDVTTVAQLKGVSYEDLSFEGSVSAGPRLCACHAYVRARSLVRGKKSVLRSMLKRQREIENEGEMVIHGDAPQGPQG